MTNPEEPVVEEVVPPVEEWIKSQPFITTAEVDIPAKLAEQVLGQEKAVTVIRKAAEQRRHVQLIGDPGTGKSMLGRAMAELLPHEELQDVIVYNNQEDNNQPKIRIVPAGRGKEIVNNHKKEAMEKKNERNRFVFFIIFMLLMGAIAYAVFRPESGAVVILGALILSVVLWMAFRYGSMRQETVLVPKLLVSHAADERAPFIDGTGAHAGALLGDVKHDPFQSGGLETPSHDRVEAGAIHKAHRGVLYIDEINTLKIESQQSLLTAMQEGEFPIVGQSERSSGAMVRTEPVPCEFILVAAGNLDALEGMHPALRSRIRGYGYEVFMESTMPDSSSNRENLIRFIAQEVAKDKKIPHFDKSAVTAILHEAQRRSGTRGHLTLRLRELGGLVRVAGDIAHENKAPLVTAEHVIEAKQIAKPLEQQVADFIIRKRTQYKSFITTGAEIGRVNGLAVIGADTGMADYSGVILPIVAEVTPAHAREGGTIVATGKLGEIAKEAVQNVSAVIKKYTGKDITSHDIHIQFIGTHEGVEGDSASVSVATAVISALEGIEVDQSVGMTGSLSIRGQVLPVGGVTAKIEAAAKVGLKRVIIPAANARDVLIDPAYRGRIEVIPAQTIGDVLEHALVSGLERTRLVERFSAAMFKRPAPAVPVPDRVAA